MPENVVEGGGSAQVRRFELREWSPDNHLRHSRFVALRDDKKAMDVKREEVS